LAKNTHLWVFFAIVMKPIFEKKINMATQNSFNGAIGAWIMSELHPKGAEYSSPNSNFSSLRLNKVYESLDFLCICFYTIDMTNPDQPTISTGNKVLETIIKDAREQNPNIKLFATLG
jgi:hypothetical protein